MAVKIIRNNTVTASSEKQVLPSISVVIPTRDRGATVTVAIDSLLGNHWPHAEIIVVDQSKTGETRDAVAPYGNAVRYIHSKTFGSASARNLGARQARAPIIGFVDDDCEVAGDWFATVAAEFASDPDIGVLFGNVLAGAHDESLGFVPAYVREQPFTARSIKDKNQVEGISACMASTRATWQDINGFDVMLGVGAPLGSGAETDYTIRALLAGHHVRESPALQVTHNGFRDWKGGKRLVQRYWFGTGAMFAKHIKHPRWSVVLLLMSLTSRWLGGGRSTLASSFGNRPYRFVQLMAFIRGLGAGFLTRSDRQRGHFRNTAASGDQA